MDNENATNNEEYISMEETLQHLQRKMKEAKTPEEIRAIGAAIADVLTAMAQEQSIVDKLQLANDELDFKKEELAEKIVAQEQQMRIEEKKVAATKFAAVLGVVSAVIVGGVKVYGVVTQGSQALQFQREGYKEEKSDEPVCYKANKHMIPNVFTNKL
jgi:hypothetical protein